MTFAIGALLVLTVLWEAFETIILPRRVRRRFRLTRLYYRTTWVVWRSLTKRLTDDHRKEPLSFFGPLSLLGLLAIWAAGLVLGFAAIHYGLGSQIRNGLQTPGFATDLYFSSTSFFTLGLGDVAPVSWPARFVTGLEAGVGFGFLAIVIGYLPVLYQSFSRREVIISLLDARAGSPPTAVELLRRHAEDHALDGLERLLHDWEQWSAELLESHLSYPVLAYFRSQHDNQSWLGALTTILDASALVIATGKGTAFSQAKLTFAIARHAVVDLSQVLNTRPESVRSDRLTAQGVDQLQRALQAAGFDLGDTEIQQLAHLRRMYEPYVDALGRYLEMELPPWMPDSPQKDNWQTTAWKMDR